MVGRVQKYGICCLLFFLPLLAQAKIFRNAYVAFELPSNWSCRLEQTEWVCRSQYKKQSKEAVIILTAKEIGPTDSFSSYEGHLMTPRTIIGRGGKKIRSKVYHTKKVKINSQQWVDGWHLGSEIPSYYTRYLATIKDRIAILVTFSAHKLHYTKYVKDFFRAIQSLHVIATKGLLKRPDIGKIRPGHETLGGPISQAMPQDMFAEEDFPDELEPDSGSSSSMVMGIAIILLAIGGYIYIKKRKS